MASTTENAKASFSLLSIRAIAAPGIGSARGSGREPNPVMPFARGVPSCATASASAPSSRVRSSCRVRLGSASKYANTSPRSWSRSRRPTCEPERSASAAARLHARNVLPVPPLVEKTATTTPVGPREPLALALPRMPPFHSTARRSASLNSFLPFVRSTTSRTPPRTSLGNEPSTGTSRTRSTAVAADSRAENSASAIASSSPTDGARTTMSKGCSPSAIARCALEIEGSHDTASGNAPNARATSGGNEGEPPTATTRGSVMAAPSSMPAAPRRRTGSGAGASARRGPAPARR